MGQLISLDVKRSAAALTDLRAVSSKVTDIEALYGVAVEDLMATILLLEELDGKLGSMILALPATVSKATFEIAKADVSSQIKRIKAHALEIAAVDEAVRSGG